MPAESASRYYDEYWARGVIPAGSDLAPRLAQLLSAAAGPGVRCLDVGCGNGHGPGTFLRPRVGTYVGVDVSARAVDEARALGLDARLVDDAAELPFTDGAFDLVVCVEVLEHLLRPDRAAREIARVLAPGGTLIATVPNTAYWRRRLDALLGRWHPMGDALSVSQPWRDPHLRFFTRGTLGAMLAATGFADVRVSGHGGGVVRELPLVRGLGHGGVSRTYQRLERRAPALLAARLNAVAIRASTASSAPRTD